MLWWWWWSVSNPKHSCSLGFPRCVGCNFVAMTWEKKTIAKGRHKFCSSNTLIGWYPPLALAKNMPFKCTPSRESLNRHFVKKKVQYSKEHSSVSGPLRCRVSAQQVGAGGDVAARAPNPASTCSRTRCQASLLWGQDARCTRIHPGRTLPAVAFDMNMKQNGFDHVSLGSLRKLLDSELPLLSSDLLTILVAWTTSWFPARSL